MTRWTFEIQWPVPFKQGWQTSGRTFISTKDAAIALADYLEISADNGTMIEGRLMIDSREETERGI